MMRTNSRPVPWFLSFRSREWGRRRTRQRRPLATASWLPSKAAAGAIRRTAACAVSIAHTEIPSENDEQSALILLMKDNAHASKNATALQRMLGQYPQERGTVSHTIRPSR
jgi:hypothetical protein